MLSNPATKNTPRPHEHVQAALQMPCQVQHPTAIPCAAPYLLASTKNTETTRPDSCQCNSVRAWLTCNSCSMVGMYMLSYFYFATQVTRM